MKPVKAESLEEGIRIVRKKRERSYHEVTLLYIA